MRAVTLVDALKRMLKGRGITYAKVAEELGLSEASVKRMFSRRDFTIQRLEDVCRAAGIDFGELAHEVTAEDAGMAHLTAEQEQEIVSDPALMLVALCAVGHWTLEQIVDTYDIPRSECIRCLARLDKRRIIELMPGNRIRPLISRTFSWLPNGPIQRHFRARIESEYLSSKFDRPGELFLFVNGMLSRQSTAEVIARIRRVAGDFADLHGADRSLPLTERHGTSMLLAIRPWEPRAFRRLRRAGREPVPAGRLLNPTLGHSVPLPPKRARAAS
ncbi:MAG TPA: helix-turn-helix transcriptional regulator [Casimicrobiaceae bacterium]